MRGVLSGVVVLTLAVPGMAASAPALTDVDRQSLLSIAAVARWICPEPKMDGHSLGVGGSVGVEGVIPKLIAKFLQVKITAQVRGNADYWSGVLQKDLAKAKATSDTCAANVFNHMFDAFYLTNNLTHTGIARPENPKVLYKAFNTTNEISTVEAIETHYGTDARGQSGGISSTGDNNNISLTEIQREHREKYLTMLQDILSKGDVLLLWTRTTRPTDKDVDAKAKEFVSWVNTSASTIASQMTPAAVLDFISVKPPDNGATVIFSDPLKPDLSPTQKETYRIMWYELPEYLDNVKFLMLNDVLDPQNGSAQPQ